MLCSCLLMIKYTISGVYTDIIIVGDNIMNEF